MNLTWDRRYDKWEQHIKDRERCNTCMYDAPEEELCCKHQCGEYSFCTNCKAKCRAGKKLCEK